MPITQDQIAATAAHWSNSPCTYWAELCRDNSIAELRSRMNVVRGDINALRTINTLARAARGTCTSAIKRKSEPAIRYSIEVK